MIQEFSHEGSAGLMLDVINAILEEPGGMTICDLMACEGSITSQLKVGKKVYVDIQKRPIKNFEKDKDIFVNMDSIEFLMNTGMGFSAMLCLDGIEHLSKDRGNMMLHLMKQKSRIQIVFTPLGDFLVDKNTADPDAHKSGWLPEEFESDGWAVLSFPNFHPVHGVGAFFAFHVKEGLQAHFERVTRWCRSLETGLEKDPPIHTWVGKQ